MPIPQLPGALNTVDDIKNYIMRLERELRFMMESGLDSTNAFEFGGWRVKDDMIVSKDADVGMSTADTAADDVRFFAGPNGDVWFYYVTKSGKLYATDAFITGLITGSTIIGGVIKTAETGARIELSGGVLTGYSEANNLHGLVFSPIPETTLFDLYLYHDGIRLLEFIDNVLGVTIRGSSLSVGMTLGDTSAPTFGAGSWTFIGDATFDNDINGKATEAYFADHAGTASAADELSPSGEIAWAQVLKAGSSIADIATRNLSSLTEDSSHRTVNDTEKSTWNGKASKTLPSWTALTLSNFWVDFGGVYATAGYYKDDMSVVRLKGVIKNGTIAAGTILFTLPVGYRPSLDIILTSLSSSAGTATPIAIEVSAAGVVKIGSFNAGSTWLSLDGLSFRAEQ